MKTYLDCVACLVRQTLEAARISTDNVNVQEEIMREALSDLQKMPYHYSPPFMAQRIHKIIRDKTKNEDPYKEIKNRFNQFALKLYPKIKKIVDNSEDPFETAVRLAIAGNIIDFGVSGDINENKVEETIQESLKKEFAVYDINKLKRSVNNASLILYLADNTGEIVFDKFLVNELSEKKVIFVVKGSPVLNDATMEDAIVSGMTDLVEVMDNGFDAPGTIIDSCSNEFKKRFNEADLIISKGQGNYESLSNTDKNIFFLLKAKCEVIAKDINCSIGDMIVLQKK